MNYELIMSLHIWMLKHTNGLRFAKTEGKSKFKYPNVFRIRLNNSTTQRLNNSTTFMSLTENRKNKFKEVAGYRQNDLTVVLENVHDPHNIGAVIRTCDAVGIGEIFILNTDESLKNKSQYCGKASASGAKKWVEIHYYEEAGKCFDHIRRKYKRIFGTHLSVKAISLFDLDLKLSCAFVFGNEHDGISKETLSFLDGNIIVPQFGMVKSLNVSVACAVTLYEACRQRISSGKYKLENELTGEALKWYKKFLKKDNRV